MSEAIKLFGQTISLPSFYQSRHQAFDLSHKSSSSTSNESCCEETGNCGDDFSDETAVSLHEFESPSELQGQEIHRELLGKEIPDDKLEDSTLNQDTEDSKDPTISKVNEKTKTDRETSPSKENSKNGEQQSETPLKKPDKILPCPRCNSMDTKFCYYNNYNVNQPRHFCKNCQRYWTAGGTMRNVPVGAGRRKNKNNAASHYRHIILSEALRSAQLHGANGVQKSAFGGSSTILTFGSDPPLCESVASVLHLSEKTQDSYRNGCHKPDQKILVSCGRKAENGDDSLSGNSVTASNTSETVISPQVQCFPGSPWQYPWNSAIPSSPAAFCPSGFPVSFYPAQAYWGCTVPNPWNSPCLSPQSPSVSNCMASNPTSPLGKHSRDGKLINHSQSEDLSTGSNNCSERSVLVPKTLIDDPTEAAKSSVWTTIGMKPKKSGLGLFTGFQMKNEERNFIAEIKTSVLQANPAALSRSLKLHETA